MHKSTHRKGKILFRVLFLSILLISSFVVAQDSLKTRKVEGNGIVTERKAEPSPFRKVENNAFTVGERLVFDVRWSIFKAGEAVMAIPAYDSIKDRQCYQVAFDVNSIGFFNLIYKVRDRYATYIDVEGLFPWRFKQHLREGSYERDFSAEFDQLNHKAKTAKGEYDVPPDVHDIVSAFYFIRTLDFHDKRVGDRIRLQNFYRDSTYALDVKFLGRQKIETDAGTFNCIIVEPLVKEGGLFKHEGRIIIWLTDDERKIPVKVRSDIKVGAVESELREYSGIYGSIHAKVNGDDH